MHFRSDDAQLFYTEQGSGLPVLLLHPTPVDHRFWTPIAEQLSAHYRVIMPDLRGHGQSELGPNQPPHQNVVSIEQLGADIERLLDELKIPQAILVGCSIGGYLLYELWRRCPDRVLALAFCSSKPEADTESARAARERNLAMVRDHGVGPFVEVLLGSLIGEPTRQHHPEKVAEARTMMLAMTQDAVLAVQQGLGARPDSVATARTITVPSCVVAGELDAASTPDQMRALAEAIASTGAPVRYHHIEKAGHYAPWEQPEVVGPLLLRFIESVAG